MKKLRIYAELDYHLRVCVWINLNKIQMRERN